MALASAAHHSHMRVAHIATQTDFVPAATYAATASSSSLATPVSLDAPAPVIKYVTPTPDVTSVTEYIARARVAPSLQASSGLWQFSFTSVTSAREIVGSLLHLEGSAGPANLTYHEQIVAGETTQSIENFSRSGTGENTKFQRYKFESESSSRLCLCGLRSRSGIFLLLRLWKRESGWYK